MTKYEILFKDNNTGTTKVLETITAINHYNADDYISDCKRNYDDEWCEMLKTGEVTVKPVYDEVLILMEDRCTKSEAEKHLKNGTVIYDSISDYIEELKNANVYTNETEDAIRNGKVADVSAVIYADHEYCIAYVL